MEQDCVDSFPLYFENIGIRLGSKSKGKLSPQSCSIQFLKEMEIYFYVYRTEINTQTMVINIPSNCNLSAEKYFLKLVKLNQIWIVIALFR